MKYLFIYTVDDKELIQYKTDIEPPRVGDTVQLHMILNDEMLPAFRVIKIYYAPKNAKRTNVFICLKQEREG